MNRKIVGILVCILLFSTVLSAAAINTDRQTIDIDKGDEEVDNIVNSNERGLAFREFLIGRIDDLVEDENEISFFAINVRSIGYMRGDDSRYSWFHHYRKMSMSYSDFEFRGILRSRFICGVFRVVI